MEIMSMWNRETHVIYVNGAPVGYVMGAGMEIMLTDEGLLPVVIKAMMTAFDLKEVEIGVMPHEGERIAVLRTLCERCSLCPMEMIRVLNWRKVLETYLKFKGSYVKLDDGCAKVCIDGETLAVKVEGGKASVTEAQGEAELTMTGVEATRWAFGIENAVCPDPRFGNWFPLPFPYSSADSF